jgi:aldose 1-epimerase
LRTLSSSSSLLVLEDGPLVVTLAPEVGGSIAAFTIAGSGMRRDVMRPASDEALAARQPLGMASFPMIPFCGRIAHARFSFEGESFQLARNFGDSPHAIHGNAWQRTWRVAARAGNRAELVLEHDPADRPQEWPFRYDARQSFVLSPNDLTLTTEVINRDPRPMPLSFGHHPYFPISADAQIAASVTHYWDSDAAMLPSARVTVPDSLGFAGGRALRELKLDTCFAGWKQSAKLAWPDLNLALRVEADNQLDHFVVYTPPERTYFCAEPQSAAPDAVNLAARGNGESGLIVLKPGEAARANVRFAPRLATLPDRQAR